MQKISTRRQSIGELSAPTDPTMSTGVETAPHSEGRSSTGEKHYSKNMGSSRMLSKVHDHSLLHRRSSVSRNESSPCDYFFASEPPPPNVATAGLRVRQFVRPLQEREDLSSARVAIVTAGGTDVPLEREPVRYLTNLSAGNRGAGLCEQLLRSGYYVILLTSVRAVKPFVRHLLPPHPMPHILDFLSFEGRQAQQEEQQQDQQTPVSEEAIASEGEVNVPLAASTSRRLACEASEEQGSPPMASAGSIVSSSSSSSNDCGKEAQLNDSGVPIDPAASAQGGGAERGALWHVVFRDPHREAGEGALDAPTEQMNALEWELNPHEAAAAVEVYKQCRDRLLCISYRTLVEYAFLLRAIVAGAAPLRERLMICSAAAVADFYVPHAVMSQHKLRVPSQREAAACSPEARGDAFDGPSKEVGSVEMQGPSRSTSTTGAHPKRWFAESFQTGEESKSLLEASGVSDASTEPHHQQRHHMTLRLHVVPKMLLMVRAVAPFCYLVAFKLETEEQKLQERALSYLEGPGVQGVADCVVGNLQQTRALEAALFTKDGQRDVKCKIKPSPKYLGQGTIEAKLARYLIKLQTHKLKEALDLELPIAPQQ